MTKTIECSSPVHDWFGLDYTSYVVVPRSIMQSMPVEWQKRFVQCLTEAQSAVSELDDLPSEYQVNSKLNGRLVADPYRDYERGRRVVRLKPASE
jgi:hypothetical protein